MVGGALVLQPRRMRRKYIHFVGRCVIIIIISTKTVTESPYKLPGCKKYAENFEKKTNTEAKMAEAHQAVAFQFVITDEGILVHFDKTAVRTALLSFFGIYRKRILKVRTAIYRGIFPASPVSLAVIVALVALLWAAGCDPTYGALPRVTAASQ